MLTGENVVELVGAAVGIVAGVAALVVALSSRKQVKSAATKTEVEALDIVIQTLRAGYARLAAENGELWAKVRKLERQVEHWKTRYRKLWVWARDCGLEPPDEMPEDGEDE